LPDLRRRSRGPSSEPHPLLAPPSPARRRFVDRLQRSLAPRVVLVQMTRNTPLVHPRPTGLKRRATYLLDTHDLLSLRTARMRSSGARIERAIEADHEALAFDAYDALLAIQATEASRMRALFTDRPIVVVPHGLDLPPVTSARPRGDGPIRLGFLGGRDEANRDALDWFLEHVFGKLRQSLGERVVLVVAGRMGRIEGGLERGVIAMGPVESIDDFWPAIDVAINPVRYGSGLKIKNVEALAHGRALVTTPIGAEGLESAAPEGLAIAHSPQEWIERLSAWASSPQRIDEVGRAGRLYAERHFPPALAFAALDAFLAALPAEEPDSVDAERPVPGGSSAVDRLARRADREPGGRPS
jgi:glycosyltransferase involved in cell wall biosynthesis